MSTSLRPIKAIGRKRRTLGWTLLTFGLLVAGVWAASAWWGLYGPLSINNGSAYWRSSDQEVFSNSGPKWELSRNSLVYTDWWYGWKLWPDRDVLVLAAYKRIGRQLSTGGVSVGHYLMLWPIPLLLCTPAAFLLRSGITARSRALTGKCKACGYNLAGLATNAPCPECGKTRHSHG